MTNTLALWFGAILIALFAVDYFFFGWLLLVSFMRVLVEFIEYLAVWR